MAWIFLSPWWEQVAQDKEAEKRVWLLPVNGNLVHRWPQETVKSCFYVPSIGSLQHSVLLNVWFTQMVIGHARCGWGGQVAR
jgi:hypothetical protein